METYVILRRSGWRTPEEFQEAAARSTTEGERMPDDVAWIRSYVIHQRDGTVDTVCVYEAASPEAIRGHARRAELPVDESVKVGGSFAMAHRAGRMYGEEGRMRSRAALFARPAVHAAMLASMALLGKSAARIPPRVGVALVLAVAALACGFALTLPAFASSTDLSFKTAVLARAQTIRADLSARYQLLPGRKLVVTEASSTSVVESFTLVSSNLQDARTVAATDGVWYAICPARAVCPYPARHDGRPASAHLPRRLALELAMRTLLETSASVVAVSLPTPHFFTVFVMSRDEMTRDADLLSLARAARRDPLIASTLWPRSTVDRVTRSRIFVFVGLEPTSTGRESFAAIPRWPDLGHEG